MFIPLKRKVTEFCMTRRGRRGKPCLWNQYNNVLFSWKIFSQAKTVEEKPADFLPVNKFIQRKGFSSRKRFWLCKSHSKWGKTFPRRYKMHCLMLIVCVCIHKYKQLLESVYLPIEMRFWRVEPSYQPS